MDGYSPVTITVHVKGTQAKFYEAMIETQGERLLIRRNGKIIAIFKKWDYYIIS